MISAGLRGSDAVERNDPHFIMFKDWLPKEMRMTTKQTLACRNLLAMLISVFVLVRHCHEMYWKIDFGSIQSFSDVWCNVHVLLAFGLLFFFRAFYFQALKVNDYLYCHVWLHDTLYFNHDHDFCFTWLIKYNHLWYLPAGYLSWKCFISISHLHFALATSLYKIFSLRLPEVKSLDFSIRAFILS